MFRRYAGEITIASWTVCRILKTSTKKIALQQSWRSFWPLHFWAALLSLRATSVVSYFWCVRIFFFIRRACVLSDSRNCSMHHLNIDIGTTSIIGRKTRSFQANSTKSFVCLTGTKKNSRLRDSWYVAMWNGLLVSVICFFFVMLCTWLNIVCSVACSLMLWFEFHSCSE